MRTESANYSIILEHLIIIINYVKRDSKCNESFSQIKNYLLKVSKSIVEILFVMQTSRRFPIFSKVRKSSHRKD